LCSRTRKPTEEDQVKLTRVLNYVRTTSELGLVYKKQKDLKLAVYCDAAHLIHSDMHGHTGIVLRLGTSTIYCESKKQTLISQSSTESELISCNTACNAIIWTKLLLSELGLTQGTVTVYQDNQSCIQLIQNGRPLGKNRHISMRLFRISELLQQSEIRLEYLSSEQMMADILTKPLEGGTFSRLRDDLLNKAKTVKTPKISSTIITSMATENDDGINLRGLKGVLEQNESGKTALPEMDPSRTQT
jgi:hypothetical protein